METYDKPTLRCLVSFPIEADPDWYTAPAVVSLETAAELKTRGYMVLVDPQDQEDLVRYEQVQRAVKNAKKWFEI